MTSSGSSPDSKKPAASDNSSPAHGLPRNELPEVDTPNLAQTDELSAASLQEMHERATLDQAERVSKLEKETPSTSDMSATQSQLTADSGTQQSLGTGSEVSAQLTLAQTLVPSESVSRTLDLNDSTLGEFRLLRRLGAGGMAQVYLAEQTSLKRNVAIKVMRSDFGSDETHRKRFEHEARAAAGLNHPNIVQVFAVGEEENIQYIAQEYVQGVNLRQYLQKKKPPNTQIALHLMKQVSSALHAAHQAGIVHRDIKPENIMVTRRMVAKVTDFGLAQLTLGGERVNLTQMGVTMGTPLYMSPEQVNGASVDARSDLYSMGVTFYHLLSGSPPFRAATAFALAYKHLNEDAPPLQDLRPDLPASLIQVVHRLMLKDPAERFSDARAVLSELKRIEKSGETGGDFSHNEESEPAGTWQELKPTRHQLKKYALWCLAVFLIAAGAGRDLQRKNPLDASINSVTSVEIKLTAKEQVEMARSLKGGPSRPERQEEAWQAVIDNFEDDRGAVLTSHRELGLLQLKARRYKDALAHFDELARENDNRWKADGVAGQAVLAMLAGRHEDSHELISIQLADHRDLVSPELKKFVEEAEQRNREFGSADEIDFESLFESPVEN
jgi:eukaryotic-like serine/threonine-protein kinase